MSRVLGQRHSKVTDRNLIDGMQYYEARQAVGVLAILVMLEAAIFLPPIGGISVGT